MTQYKPDVIAINNGDAPIDVLMEYIKFSANIRGLGCILSDMFLYKYFKKATISDIEFLYDIHKVNKDYLFGSNHIKCAVGTWRSDIIKKCIECSRKNNIDIPVISINTEDKLDNIFIEHLREQRDHDDLLDVISDLLDKESFSLVEYIVKKNEEDKKNEDKISSLNDKLDSLRCMLSKLQSNTEYKITEISDKLSKLSSASVSTTTKTNINSDIIFDIKEDIRDINNILESQPLLYVVLLTSSTTTALILAGLYAFSLGF